MFYKGEYFSLLDNFIYDLKSKSGYEQINHIVRYEKNVWIGNSYLMMRCNNDPSVDKEFLFESFENRYDFIKDFNDLSKEKLNLLFEGIDVADFKEVDITNLLVRYDEPFNNQEGIIYKVNGKLSLLATDWEYLINSSVLKYYSKGVNKALYGFLGNEEVKPENIRIVMMPYHIESQAEMHDRIEDYVEKLNNVLNEGAKN